MSNANDLVDVRPKDGSGDPTRVSQAALDRWPDTWERIDAPPTDPAPVGEEPKATKKVAKPKPPRGVTTKE